MSGRSTVQNPLCNYSLLELLYCRSTGRQGMLYSTNVGRQNKSRHIPGTLTKACTLSVPHSQHQDRISVTSIPLYVWWSVWNYKPVLEFLQSFKFRLKVEWTYNKLNGRKLFNLFSKTLKVALKHLKYPPLKKHELMNSSQYSKWNAGYNSHLIFVWEPLPEVAVAKLLLFLVLVSPSVALWTKLGWCMWAYCS